MILYQSPYFIWEGDLTAINGDITPFYTYLDTCYLSLRDHFGYQPAATPISILIDASSKCAGGIGGWTSGGRIGFCAGNWGLNRWCLGITAQELVNLFTGYITGGWPSTWWADSKSPFPIMISCLLMEEQNYVSQATERRNEFHSDPLFVMFERLHRDFNWLLWKNLFSLIRAKGVNLANYSEGVEKTSLVQCFLNHAANKDLSSYYQIGNLPIDPLTIKKYDDQFFPQPSELIITIQVTKL